MKEIVRDDPRFGMGRVGSQRFAHLMTDGATLSGVVYETFETINYTPFKGATPAQIERFGELRLRGYKKNTIPDAWHPVATQEEKEELATLQPLFEGVIYTHNRRGLDCPSVPDLAGDPLYLFVEAGRQKVKFLPIGRQEAFDHIQKTDPSWNGSSPAKAVKFLHPVTGEAMYATSIYGIGRNQYGYVVRGWDSTLPIGADEALMQEWS